jgi:putative transposase
LNKVRARSILGEEDFIERIENHLRGKKEIPEIPKSQRYMNRPILGKLFEEEVIGDKRRRDKRIVEAVEGFGYSQREVADYLGMHFSSIRRIIRQK